MTGTIAQRRRQRAQDSGDPVPVYAVLPGKTVLLGQIFADGPETSFRLSAPLGTRKILLDPYQNAADTIALASETSFPKSSASSQNDIFLDLSAST